ncbi:MAG: antitoxin [Solirubrobacteraceae bacterium]
MRTTVTLDPDVEAKLRQATRERGQSFKVVLNDAVRSGLSGNEPSTHRYRLTTRPMGVRPNVDLDRALSIAGDLEDAEIVRKLRLRK